ncbi:hypothetical protein FJ976_24020 [Mesorhizobium sp. B1-1-9]|uniref:hypothetical protein n=1 Tax=Mesorhizobium sp. B1-1-9 TaxID=2589975 RepID=UPI0011266721|nr:hypothetical protein [Mesorhizobium sp. B1-1-9]TPN45304.1 hypothetical protein FJ976_24020 [Mesorhizobium sp. B1-1-9]
MEQVDLEPDFLVQQAARWLIETPKSQRPLPAVIELRARFPLDAQGACQAIRLGNLIRSGGADAAA